MCVGMLDLALDDRYICCFLSHIYTSRLPNSPKPLHLAAHFAFDLLAISLHFFLHLHCISTFGRSPGRMLGRYQFSNDSLEHTVQLSTVAPRQGDVWCVLVGAANVFA